jgi:4-amino-4-deoxy-L-arabinose transferase-like glycosyltransferase
MLFLLCFILALAIGAVHLYLDKQPRTRERVVQTLLLWLLVVCVGFASVLTFIADAFFADRMAASLGWPAGNPFQSLAAVANLTIGVLGILCYRKRENFWVATVVAFAVWWPGAAAVHIRDMMVSGNYAPNNAGVTVYMDILVPVVLVALLTYYERVSRHEGERAHARA